jgi:hypothetical protein
MCGRDEKCLKLLVIRPERTDHLGDIKQMYESKMDLKETGSDMD